MKVEEIKDTFERLSEKDAKYVCDIINAMSSGLQIEDIKIPEISNSIPLKKNDLGFDEDFIEPENPTMTFSNEDIEDSLLDEDFSDDILEVQNEPNIHILTKEEQEDIDDFNSGFDEILDKKDDSFTPDKDQTYDESFNLSLEKANLLPYPLIQQKLTEFEQKANEISINVVKGILDWKLGLDSKFSKRIKEKVNPEKVAKEIQNYMLAFKNLKNDEMLSEYLHIALEDFPTSKNYKYEQLAASHILPHYGIEYDYKEAIR